LTDARDALQLTIDVLDADAGTVKGSAQIELTRLEALKTQAETNYDTVNGSLAHANVVLEDGENDLAMIIAGTDTAESASLASLNDALAVATYLHGLKVVERDEQQAISDLNTDGGTDVDEDDVEFLRPSIAELTNLANLSAETNTRA
jgi:hypothetical protein